MHQARSDGGACLHTMERCMKTHLAVKLTRAFDGGPLAVLDLPGEGAELRPHQLRALAAALVEVAEAAESRKLLHRGKPLPALRMTVELGA